MTSAPYESWVAGADQHPDFSPANLPLGIFSHGDTRPRGGVAIGDSILDLGAALAEGCFDGLAEHAAQAASGDSLNAFFALGAPARQALRRQLLALLDAHHPQCERWQGLATRLLLPMQECQMHLPARVGDYTDFYVGIHHATRVGRLLRPDTPLLPNYKYVPIAYHGRASTLCVSGTPIKRPHGQVLAAGSEVPVLGPSQRLDYELEMGIWVGPGNAAGMPIDIQHAGGHVAGFCLLNDWSARDLQAWEYQPLGPFLSKSFATSLSPWVVTAEALAPFRRAQPARADGDPAPLAYLYDEHDQQHGALDIELEVLLLTAAMREQGRAAQRLALSNTLHMYWTVAQMITHHSVNGCKLQPGDLLGTGTLSGPDTEALGSLFELTAAGTHPLILTSGESRRFLEAGDEVILRARCVAPGQASIGFGECRGRVLD